MKTLLFIVVGLFLISCGAKAHKEMEGANLLWSEEFDYSGQPNNEFWGFELGDGCPTLCGWGNNESQIYLKNSDNVRVENGNLIIEAHSNTLDTTVTYTSARLSTKGKKSWKYGYFEVRAKIPTGLGTWPAIWMLPLEWKYGGWPESGEIDIMEHVGYDPGMVHGTVHTAAYNGMIGTQRGNQIKLDEPNEFNVYAINWTPEKIQFIVNDKVYHTFDNNGKGSKYWPYDQEYYLILNIAVGGDWGGKMGIAEDIWPQRMEIDYVRVYDYKKDLITEEKPNE